MAVFSPQSLKSGFCLDFSWKWAHSLHPLSPHPPHPPTPPTPHPPTPKEESKCKNAQFLQWILKDDDVVYFKKITAS